jgi:hypothetical protein
MGGAETKGTPKGRARGDDIDQGCSLQIDPTMGIKKVYFWSQYKLTPQGA